jgi:hypothetical protein
LNTGRRVTDGLNRFVRYTRKLKLTGRTTSPVGAAGRKEFEQKLLVCVWGDGPLAFLQDDFNHRGGL